MDEASIFEKLLVKYAGGRMPPLVDADNPEAGLVNGKLLEIYHSGLLAKHSIPIGILLANRSDVSLEGKWQGGDFELNEWAKPYWPAFCTKLRETPIGNKVCDECDKRHAIIAEQRKKDRVITYLCDNGLVDFATPILVKDKVVAVLLCGQFRPEEGPVWNPEFVQPGGVFRLLKPKEKDQGVDAWTASLQRIQNIEHKLGLGEGTLLESLVGGIKPAEKISPAEVVKRQELLKHTAEQLSHLATSAYELEKGKVVDQIRSRITSSLVEVGISEDPRRVWTTLSDSLAYVTRNFALDYCLILSLGKDGNEIRILCHSGLPEGKFQPGKSLPAIRASFSSLRDTISKPQKAIPIVLRDFKDLPVFDQLHHLHKKSRQQVVFIPLVAPGNTNPIMVLGRFQQDTDIDFLQAQGDGALSCIIEAVALVTEVVLLVEELQETTSKQAMFLEDVAHNIRTPVQNVVVEAEVLTRGLVPPTGIERRALRIAAQVRRLHLLSQRAWTLVNIDRGLFGHEKTERVDAYQIIMEQRKSLLDLAERRGIQISVDRGLENWPPIQVNRELFTQAVLNLIDNAVKYSRDGTEVRVDGKRVPGDVADGKPVPGGVTLSFVNRGIPIREEDKERIFDRYYRSAEAERLIPTGTGIGLAIVQAFVNYHRGSVEVNTRPVAGTRDYVIEFRVFIPGGGMHYA